MEVDGDLHGSDEGYRRDGIRDDYFNRLGMETYRVSAAEVYRDADFVADGVKLLAGERLRVGQGK